MEMSRQEIGHQIYDRLVELSRNADGLVAQGKFYDALYMGAGKEIFENEDPKYLAFLRQHAVLPD